MSSISPTDILAIAAAATTLCWVSVIVQWLSVSGAVQRQLALGPILLAFAAFVPAAVALTSTTHAAFTGSAATSLNSLLGSLYLLGIGALFVMSPSRAATTSRSNRSIFILLLLYWLFGAISNYYADLPLPRLSFFLVPVLFLASWRLRPRYQTAIKILTYVSIATCVASLLLAVANPAAAFEGATRSATFLVSNRLAGIFEQANTMGLFASVAFVLAWRAGGWTRRLGSPFCGYVLIASDSRTAWLGAAVALCILFAGAAPKTGVTRRLPPSRVLLGGGLLVAVLIVISYAIPAAQLDTFTGRTAIWHFVLQNWTGSPIIGHGPTIWAKLIAAGIVPAYVGQAHNQFFQTLYTTGLVGVLLFVSLMYIWTVKSIRAARAGYWLPAALQSLIVVYGVFESPLSPWAIGSEIWLLSIVLFLDPIGDDLIRGLS